MTKNKQLPALEGKAIIYQLMPRLYTNNRAANEVPDGDIGQNGVGKFNDITAAVLGGIKALGATHVWYTGIIRHGTATDYSAHGIPACDPHLVKGKAGSPYAIADYYDVDPDLAQDVDRRIDEWQKLIARTHRKGLRVVMDFVPNHVFRQYHSIAAPAGTADLGEGDNTGMFFDPQNNFHYITGEPLAPNGVDLGGYTEMPAKATGNDCFNAHPGVNDWYETVKLNYGVDPWNGSRHFDPIPSTWHKMLAILRYWAGMGVDAFRCDMVHMVPVDFWHWAIAAIKSEWPAVQFIAEIYDPALYDSYINYGGFDYLYDKVGLYDTLIGISKGHRPASDLTACWQATNGLQPHLLNFLENHDEQRLSSAQCLGNGESALPALVVSATISSAPFMLYMGQELGEPAQGAKGFSGDDGRTSIFDYCTVPSLVRMHKGRRAMTAGEKSLQQYYSRLLSLCASLPALSRGSFFDLMWVNAGTVDTRSVYCYLRHCGQQTALVVVNFGGETQAGIRIPAHAFDVLKLDAGTADAREELSGTALQVHLQPDCVVPVSLPARGAVIITW